MITSDDLLAAFNEIGVRARLVPAGLDMRVEADRSGVEVTLRHDDKGPYFEVRVNYTRVVDLRVAEVDTNARQLVIVAEDWGRSMDAPPLIFRAGLGNDGWFVADVTETNVGDIED